jgi:peptide deformylase
VKVLEIQTGADNPILRQKSTKVDKIDKSIKKFAKDLLKTMVKANGLGIAAPQVGINKRLFITTFDEGSEHAMAVLMINPEILWHSDDTDIAEEGCLSLPKLYKPVPRSTAIRVKFQDLKGTEHVLELEGLNARVVQHENDHLDGILFIDKAVESKLSDDDSSHVAF